MDLARLAQARLQTGPYRVVPGDVLQLEMPAHLFPEALGAQAAAGGKTTQNCRVDGSGAIVLPDGRQLLVKGLSLTEVESTVADAYYPNLVRTRPAVYAQVVDYATANIRIMGAVTKPGIYRVRHDQMSLVGVLMEAGEIVEGGAARIRIVRQTPTGDGAHPSPQVDLMRSLGGASDSVRAAGVPARMDSEYRDQPIPGLFVRFKKEGQLRTTGRLIIENGDGVLVNRWLDVAVPDQRRAALCGADAGSGRLPLDRLDASLSRLARFLDSQTPLEGARHLNASDTNWPAAPAGAWVASVGDAGDATGRVQPAGVLKKLVYEDSESPRTPTGNEMVLNLPVRGLNIPFSDVPLVDGDTVIVERNKPQTISVIGLVARPGSFPYPPDVRYTLAEALALAGGLDMVAEPHFVSVYRLRNDGTIAGATFQFSRSSGPEHLTAALALEVKPGDVISVEHTLRTRTNVFFDRIVRITLGWYVQPDDFWK
jgi:protein involved in polysaccharide export with SLBB domain